MKPEPRAKMQLYPGAPPAPPPPAGRGSGRLGKLAVRLAIAGAMGVSLVWYLNYLHVTSPRTPDGERYQARRQAAERAPAPGYDRAKAKAAFLALSARDRFTQEAMDRAFRNPGLTISLADGYLFEWGVLDPTGSGSGFGKSRLTGEITSAQDETQEPITWCQWAERYFTWIWRCTGADVCYKFQRSIPRIDPRNNRLTFIYEEAGKTRFKACRDPLTGLWDNYRYRSPFEK